MTKKELKNLIKETISEVVKEEAHMTTSDLEAAHHYIEHLQELVNDNSDLEDWVKAKINIAKENLRSVFEYLSHESKNQEQSTVEESSNNINLDLKKIKNIEVDGIKKYDFPDFVDAYVVSASYLGRKLTDEELNWLNNNHPEIAQNAALQHSMTGGGMYEEKTKKWIQKAVDPKHKGYCTPMTKPTCTPARKALAKRFKKGI